MTPEQTSEFNEALQQMRQATARLQQQVDFLASPLCLAQIMERQTAAVISAHSLWLNRKAAAAYCFCGESEIDRASTTRRQGGPVFPRYELAASPRYLKADLDEAIRAGKWSPYKPINKAA